jgi:hypothetical protein
LEDAKRAQPAFVAIEARDIEVKPIGGEFVPEVGRGREGFPVKELILLEAVDGFDVALPSIGFDGDVVVP